MTRSEITIRGAREHNLRDVSLVLPKNKLIVMTGVSGSGKSSLAFDTLYAEGQRRYIESLSTYARQFLGSMPKPDVDSITGLAPSISIQQKTAGRNPRSTVGTITEIYDYLRVLFARVGQAECHQCHRPITSQAPENIVEQILLLPVGTKFQILAPLIQRQKGEFKDLFVDLLKQGYLRARVDGKFISLSESLQLDKQMKHTIDVVIDRLMAGKSTRQRVAEAVENSLKLANGQLIVLQDSPEEFLSAAIQSEDDSPSQENPSEQFLPRLMPALIAASATILPRRNFSVSTAPKGCVPTATALACGTICLIVSFPMNPFPSRREHSHFLANFPSWAVGAGILLMAWLRQSKKH